jgi:colanic acid biosynthesis protein WcaH
MPPCERVPERLYRKILRVMPVACTDAVIVHGRSFLLGKRTNKPAKGQWFFIGGRIFKGEALELAVKRYVRAETGLTGFKVKKFLATEATMFRNSAQGPSSHTINSVFLIEAPGRILFPSKEHKELKWFTRINKNWHPYVKKMLKLAGFK